jgi:hypothetical protein
MVVKFQSGGLRDGLQTGAVIVLNPLLGALIEPYCSRASIFPWAMGKTRFPWPARGLRRVSEATDGIREGEAWSRRLLINSTFADRAFGTRNSSAYHPSNPPAKLRLYHLYRLLRRNTINY